MKQIKKVEVQADVADHFNKRNLKAVAANATKFFSGRKIKTSQIEFLFNSYVGYWKNLIETELRFVKGDRRMNFNDFKIIYFN